MRRHATRMSATSLDAFAHFVMGDALPAQQRQIVEYLRSGPATRSEIAKATGISVSSVTGRVHELVKNGVIEECSRRPCSITGVNCYVVRLAKQQGDLFAA